MNWLKKLFSRTPKPTQKRGYKDVIAVGGTHSDWALNQQSEDADARWHLPTLRARSRDLFKTDPYFGKYTEELWANVFGENGTTLRMKVKETEDRVVYAPDEKAFLAGKQRRRDKLCGFISRRYGARIGLPPVARFLDETKAMASIQVGALDVFANDLIERRWKEWQRKEYATTTKRFTYQETRQLRLVMAARDGDFFIRLIRDPRINKFGFSLQLINADWCDVHLNCLHQNGNEIRMGVEFDKWGAAVRYYIIKRQPNDWQYGIPSGYSGGQLREYEIIEAKDLIHYARFRDSDSTRPVPWCVSVIGKSRHLNGYEEAEVTAARASACKMGFFKSTLVSEGGQGAGQPDPQDASIRSMEATPGGFEGLPYGVEFQDYNPNHPNGNFDQFRKAMLRSWCAGLPGANYNIIANDLEGVNYSSGRLGMLDERELWKLIQRFDIETAERPIFEAWLEMSLITGAIPLPLAKLEKFNKPHFSGRRWTWVDPKKEVEGNALAIANRFTSYSRIFDDAGLDLEEVWTEIAEEQMLAEALGIELPAINAPASTANGSDMDSESDGGSEALANIEQAKARADAYGVGVRAGAITPNDEDEAEFRELLSLPKMNGAVRSAWTEDGGVRRPITIVPKDGVVGPAPGAAAIAQGDDEEEDPPKKPKAKGRAVFA